MREIKFKAYYKADKRIYEVLYLDFANNELGLWDKETEIDFECSFEDVELMQYAGLKDKNGVEIYDGYILELRANPFDRKRDLFQVVFKDGGFRDEWNNYIGQYLPPDIRNKQGGRVRLNEACEVVGNIYENKILIGVKNEPRNF